MLENDAPGGDTDDVDNSAPGDGGAALTDSPPAKKRTAKKATAKKAAKKTAAKTKSKSTASDDGQQADRAPAEPTDAEPTEPAAPSEPAPVRASEAATVGEAADADGEQPPLDAAAEPAPASQPRRRGASRPPGPPEPVEDPRTAVFLPPRPVDPPPPADDEPSAAETAPATAGGEADEAVDDSADSADRADSTGSADSADDVDDGADDDDEDRPKRRRRRGGRGRRRRSGQRDGTDDAEGSDDDASDDADGSAAAASSDDEADGEQDEQRGSSGGSSSSRRRRRRRRRATGDNGGAPAPDDPPNTVVKVREPRDSDPDDEVTALKGSTRLEAKRQRRRDGRDPGRRRAPVLTESEFLARREAVNRVMVVRQVGDRTQIAICEDDVLVEHYVERGAAQSYVGNVYLGRVQNVLPSMEAAFVDIGRGRNAVLYAGEVNFAGVDLGNQPKRIESVLKSGQSVLVQVTKGPVGQKGARLTSQIGLPGRYLVYSPAGSTAGISRKLPDKERERLKQVLKKALPEDGGVIVRTAAEGASEEELGRDVNRLAAQWETIQQKAKSANAPALLYEEPDLTVRVIRDAFNEDFTKLVVAGDQSWEMIEPYVQHVAPHLADRVERWTAEQDVFSAYRIDEQLAKALDRKVWLPSGGSLVIDRTEAMTVIDVNTGKFTGQGGNLEETVTRNNLEAAEEIVRQLRLRDIGGIVVVDFIDMVLESNRDLVLRRLVECLARDRTRHQVAEVTSLGLVQMTRKRIGQGLLEAFSKPCDCCDGRGLHVSLEPVEPERTTSNNGGGGGKGKSKGKGKKQSQPKRGDSAEKIAAIAAASG